MATAPSPALVELARRYRPQVLAHEDVLPLAAPLRALLGEGGLRRGSTVVVAGTVPLGLTTLTLALAASASADGAWVAAVDLPGLGVASAAELGVEPSRLVLVPDSGRRFASTVAALLDACEVVLVGMPDRLEQAMARRLAGRALERRSALVFCAGAARRDAAESCGARPAPALWPEGADARLEIGAARWVGLGQGSGRLCARLVEVTATRRRRAPAIVRAGLWLPAPDGRLAGLDEVEGAAGDWASTAEELAVAH